MSRDMKYSGIPWIGDIPKGWDIENIGSCLKEVHNLNSDCSEDNALQFKMGTIISKKHGDSKYNPETLEAYNKVQVGDIVINGLNLSFDFISMRVGQVKENGVITSAYLTVRPLSHLDSAYVTYLFKGYDACKALHGMGKGLRQTLSYKEFRKYLIFHPSLSEQKRIASFLDRKCAEVDEMIALQEKIVEELKAYKQSVITEAVTKGLNPDIPMKDSGIEWIGEIPEHWDTCKIKNSLEINPHQCHKLEEDTEVSYMPMECLRNGIIEKRTALYGSLPSLTEFSDGDIVMAKVTPCFENGNIAIATDLTNGVGFGSSEVFVFRCHDNTLSKYAFYYLQSPYIKARGVSSMTGTGGLKRINPNYLCDSVMVLPNRYEQQEIAEYLDAKCVEIDNLISIKLSKIDNLKEYKKSIIYEYVTGKKEVIE